MAKSKTEIKPLSAERVNKLISESGMTQKEFAEKVVHCTQQHMNRMVKGNAPVTAETADQITKYFPEIRFEWLMGYDNFKTKKSYEWVIVSKNAEKWQRSWENFLNVQSKRKDTADRAFELFLCMYKKRGGSDLIWDAPLWSNSLYDHTYPVELCHEKYADFSDLYDKFRKELSDTYNEEIEGAHIFYPILELDNDGNEIPCLAEDYITAVNKVSDYARLVINDLINTSKEKANNSDGADNHEV